MLGHSDWLDEQRYELQTIRAKNNHGIFQFDRVFQIIDGRQGIKSHGPCNMPVWGSSFNNQTSLYFENYPPYDNESATRSRILALTEYLYQLQESTSANAFDLESTR